MLTEAKLDKRSQCDVIFNIGALSKYMLFFFFKKMPHFLNKNVASHSKTWLAAQSHYTGTNNGISVNIPINLIYITLQEIEVCGNFFKWFKA